MSTQIMSTQIELYAGDDFKFSGTVPLSNILRASVGRMLNTRLGDDVTIVLKMFQVLTDSQPAGNPAVYNLVPEYGYLQVIVMRDARIIYRHPHPVEDIVTLELQRWLSEKFPDVSMWGFRIAADGLPRARFVRPTPPVDGVVHVRPYAAGEQPVFGIRQIQEEAPPDTSLSALGVRTAALGASAPEVSVVVPAALKSDLDARAFSSQVEEGGFLIGRVFRDRESAAGGHILHLTGAQAAEATGASLLHFTFSGDSFGAIKRRLRASSNGERLLGWYHTHLFAATEDFGLSSIDVRLHLSTFTIPWQVAGLINIDGGVRTLRFYIRSGDTMIQCPYYLDERN